MREAISELVSRGPLPAEPGADPLRVEAYESLIRSIDAPVSLAEAQALMSVFGPDECFGLAWALVTLIESAPGWPGNTDFSADNEWVQLLGERAGPLIDRIP